MTMLCRGISQQCGKALGGKLGSFERKKSSAGGLLAAVGVLASSLPGSLANFVIT